MPVKNIFIIHNFLSKIIVIQTIDPKVIVKLTFSWDSLLGLVNLKLKIKNPNTMCMITNIS